MSKRQFTKEQIALLRKNKHISACSEKSITFQKGFKLAAVQRYIGGLPPSEIFQEAGFDLAQIGRKTPKWCLIRWRRKFDKTGAAGLEEDRRGRNSQGRPPNLASMSGKEKVKYLEAQVAYLKAENAFLAKLRKQRLNYGRKTSSGLSDC